MLIQYRGPARGAYQLQKDLREAGIEAQFDPPTERRGIEEEIVRVLMHVESVGADKVIDAGLTIVAERVIRAFRKSHPHVEAKVEPDEDAPKDTPPE